MHTAAHTHTTVTEFDLSKIKRRFDDIDIDLTGEISYEEFLDDVNEPVVGQ